jgi:hypothetical protein
VSDRSGATTVVDPSNHKNKNQSMCLPGQKQTELCRESAMRDAINLASSVSSREAVRAQ